MNESNVDSSNQKSLKILITVHQFYPEHYAGTEVLTLGLAHELKARGHHPYILAAKRSRPIHDLHPYELEDYTYEGIPVRRVGRAKEGPQASYRLDYDNERMAIRAREYAEEVVPDVVHVMHMQGISARVLEEFGSMGLPVVYTATDFWSVCPVVDMKRHDGAMCVGPELHHCVRCMASKYPKFSLERSLRGKSSKMMRAATSLPGNLLGRMLGHPEQVLALKERPDYIRDKLGYVDRIIAPTKLMKELIVSNGAAPESKVEVSHYGIDTRDIKDARDEKVEAANKRDGKLRVGFMGTLGPHKGCDVLIRAFRGLPGGVDASLTIYGNPNRYVNFVEQLREMSKDDDRIELAGAFPSEEVGRVLSTIDVLVVPSRWYENAPVVVYESFAAGVPVVATNLGGMSEVVHDGENGLLFELDDHEGLSRQLQRLAEEEGLLEQLQEGIPPVKTIGDNVRELEELYARLIQERS